MKKHYPQIFKFLCLFLSFKWQRYFLYYFSFYVAINFQCSFRFYLSFSDRFYICCLYIFFIVIFLLPKYFCKDFALILADFLCYFLCYLILLYYSLTNNDFISIFLTFLRFVPSKFFLSLTMNHFFHLNQRFSINLWLHLC